MGCWLSLQHGSAVVRAETRNQFGRSLSGLLGQREVAKGDFVYLPPWCEHGIENTGTEPLVVLIATSPPNP